MTRICCLAAAVIVYAVTGASAVEDAVRQSIINDCAGVTPVEWGEKLDGVITRFVDTGKHIALTFDACGSAGDGCDWALIGFLRKEGIPATLFISGRWIDAHPDDFSRLANDPLFEIENHGLEHKPCSVNGRSAYGIRGTDTPGGVIDEIENNALKIQRLTGKKPQYYRSGTAYYDEAAITIIHRLGYRAAGYSILGDAGATYSPGQVKKALLSAVPGSIAIMHMNHPGCGTAAGVMAAVPELKKRGFSFIRLSECMAGN